MPHLLRQLLLLKNTIVGTSSNRISCRRRMMQQGANQGTVALFSSTSTATGTNVEDEPDEDGVVSTTAAPRPRNKKPKKKKKMPPQTETDRQQQQPTRPGKNALRKLRYQQTQLSPREFLWVSAKKLALTNHACFLPSGNTTNNVDCESTTTPASIRVVTTTGAFSSMDDGCTLKSCDETVVTIKVQPLLVLDLNGILCHRIRHRPISMDDRPLISKNIANTPVIPRIDLVSFLRLLDQHFCLAVWTSAKAKTAKLLLDALIPKDIASRLLFVYAQHHCNAIQQPPENPAPDTSRSYVPPLFEKDLSRVWKEFPLWHVHNTLLYDDSPEKCFTWQNNAVHPPPLVGRKEDEVTEAQQLEFVQKLVEHWKQEPGVQVWDTRETATWSRSAQQVDLVHELVTRLGWNNNNNNDNDDT